MRALGVPYTNDEVANGVEMAKAQALDVAGKIAAQGGPKGLEDKNVVAMIAYLQRVGTDLFAKPPTTAPTTMPATPTTQPAPAPKTVAIGAR
jgi:cytochrome c oxidase cbb3-type subunit I/II